MAKKETFTAYLRRISDAQMAHAVFGGRKLTDAGVGYIYSAQLHFGRLDVEGALDGRDLFTVEG